MSELEALAQARDLLRSLERHWPADAVARVIIELPMLRGLADRLEAAEAAIEKVRAEHQGEWSCGNPRHTNPDVGCPDCGAGCISCGEQYPCPTIRAIDKERR